MPNPPEREPRDDETTQETADVKRLIQAGLQNDDQETIAAGTRRALRLIKKGMPLNEVTAQLLGLDKLPKQED